MSKQPMKTLRDMSQLLKNPQFEDVSMICDRVVTLCDGFKDTPYAKPFAKLSVVANALRTKSIFEFKAVKETLVKQCSASAAEVAEITKKELAAY